MALGKKVFTEKTYGAKLYKWSPLESNVSKKKQNDGSKKPYYCSAKPNSQGQDWITTYVYNLVVVNSEQQHQAYVECDYVQ